MSHVFTNSVSLPDEHVGGFLGKTRPCRDVLLSDCTLLIIQLPANPNIINHNIKTHLE